MVEKGEELLLKWASEVGITDSHSHHHSSSSSCLSHSLRLSNFPHAGGRGLAAARDLKRGELILRVPKCALMMTQSVMKEDQRLSLAANSHPTLSSTQILTVCLLYEVGKGKSSRWHPYLTQLPRSYDILAGYGPFEIQSLQVNYAIWAAERAKEKAETDWEEATSLMEQLHLTRHLRTFKAWIWAFATVSSRTLHIPWDDAGCLCPVGDLFNYAPPGEENNFGNSSNMTIISSKRANKSQSEDITSQCYSEHSSEDMLRLTDGGYEEEASAYCFYAKENYTEGEQVLLSYGTYTNLELLEHYGFLLDKNPNEKSFVPLEPEIYSSCSWPKHSMFIHQNGTPSFALLCSLRLWLTPPSLRRSVGHLIFSGSQLSPKNERTVMRWILRDCRMVLKNLPTSMEEDELLIFTIDKMQDLCTLNQLESVVSSFEGEAHAFLKSNCLLNGDAKVWVESKHIRRCLDQWRLAVQWRLLYKRTLADCIVQCASVTDRFLPENEE